MTTTPLMNLVLPTEGGSANVWDVILDTAFGLIDGHDHTTGKGTPVVAAGLNINGDVAWGAHNISAMGVLDFSPIAAASAASFSSALFTSSADNNLYFRNAGGTNVQITSGNTINISVVGGIGGDYASVSALLSYVDASRTYLLQQEGSPRPWAGLQTADIQLYQKAASIVNNITLKSPSALAASYTLTMPAALPAATALTYISSAGSIGFAPPSKTQAIPPAAFNLNSNAIALVSSAKGINGITLSGGLNIYSTAPVALNIGDTMTAITVHVNKVTNASTTITAWLIITNGTTGAISTFNQNNAVNAPGYTTISIPISSTTVAAGSYYAVAVGVSSGAGTTDVVMGVEVAYTPGI